MGIILVASADSEMDLDDIASEYEYDPGAMIELMREAGYRTKIINFGEHLAPAVITLSRNNKVEKIVQEGMVHDASDWIWEVDPTDYIKEPEDVFWEAVGSKDVVYHGTDSKESLDNIMREGIELRNKTRGISNRSTGPAVFASESAESTDYHYKYAVAINLGKMKQDGYMPEVIREEPLIEADLREALAHLIGLENFYDDSSSSDGLSEDTVIFDDMIPAKYLSVFKDGK